jgi:hypothetical protein
VDTGLPGRVNSSSFHFIKDEGLYKYSGIHIFFFFLISDERGASDNHLPVTSRN